VNFKYLRITHYYRLFYSIISRTRTGMITYQLWCTYWERKRVTCSNMYLYSHIEASMDDFDQFPINMINLLTNICNISLMWKELNNKFFII